LVFSKNMRLSAYQFRIAGFGFEIAGAIQPKNLKPKLVG